jgi:hypothetical protein
MVVANLEMAGLFKTFVDDESYSSGHGRAYEAYGIDPNQGTLVIVRPDQCEYRSALHFEFYHTNHPSDIARIGSLDDTIGAQKFFDGFLRRGHEHISDKV